MGMTSSAEIVVGVVFNDRQEMIELLIDECWGLPSKILEYLLDEELPFAYNSSVPYTEVLCYYDSDAPGVWGVPVESVSWDVKELVIRDLAAKVEKAGHDLISVLEEWGASQALKEKVAVHLMSHYG